MFYFVFNIPLGLSRARHTCAQGFGHSLNFRWFSAIEAAIVRISQSGCVGARVRSGRVFRGRVVATRVLGDWLMAEVGRWFTDEDAVLGFKRASLFTENAWSPDLKL